MTKNIRSTAIDPLFFSHPLRVAVLVVVDVVDVVGVVGVGVEVVVVVVVVVDAVVATKSETKSVFLSFFLFLFTPSHDEIVTKIQLHSNHKTTTTTNIPLFIIFGEFYRYVTPSSQSFRKCRRSPTARVQFISTK
jgi:hypothetical protein